MVKTLAIAMIGILFTTLYAQHNEKVYMAGMFVDSNVLNVLSVEQKDTLLTKNRAFVYYNDESKLLSYTIDHNLAVSIKEGLIKENLNMKKLSPGSGFGFRVVDNQLYGFSSGDVRNNPSLYTSLYQQAIQGI